MNRNDAEILRARIIADRTTVRQSTRYADEVRWLMTAPEDRDIPTDSLRFGAGRGLSESRQWHISVAAEKHGPSVVYLRLGKRTDNGPLDALVTLDQAHGLRQHVCDFWMGHSGQLELVSLAAPCATFQLSHGRIEQTGTVGAEEFAAGRKRAKALLRNLHVERPGVLRDQHFFDDCTIFGPPMLDPSLIAVEAIMQVFGTSPIGSRDAG